MIVEQPRNSSGAGLPVSTVSGGLEDRPMACLVKPP